MNAFCKREWHHRQLLVRTIFTAAISIGSAISAFSQGQTHLLDYGTYSGYGLGKGILGNDYGTPLPSCIIGTTVPLPASTAHLRANVVYSESEYALAFHIDQSASASFLDIGKGSEEVHFGYSNDKSARAFDIVVEAYSERPSQTLNNIDWDAVHKPMAASVDPAVQHQLRSQCGDRYIETVFNEIRLFAVLHVSSQKSSSLTQFSGKTSGSVDVGVAKASGDLGGDLNIKQAHQSGAITVEVYSEGFKDLTPDAGIIGIASADGLNAIATKLAAYINNNSASLTEQPVKYLLAPLPGLNTDLSVDQGIIDDLNKLKTNYSETHARLTNVESLLGGSDPRAAVLISPDGNNHLQQLQLLLKTYSDTAANTHQKCTQANSPDICQQEITSLGAPPVRQDVELPPALVPSLGPFAITINGKFISPADASLVLGAAGTTLYDAAKNLDNTTQNVDLIAILVGPYLAHFDVPVLGFSPTGQPITAKTLVMRAGDLQFPAYWQGSTKNALAIHVAHADSASRCPIRVSSPGPASALDESCLTPVGKAFRDVARATAAGAVFSPPTMFIDAFGGTTSDCFGSSTIPIPQPPGPGNFPFIYPTQFGILSGELSSPFSSSRTSTVHIILNTLGYPPSIRLFEEHETHNSAAEWKQIQGQRIASIPSAGLGIGNSDLCSPHIK
jgi:hypothetical protein